MPASKPEDIRNVIMLGHGGAGKTTLCEAMLYAAKVTTRLGSVDDGTTTMDFTDTEKDRKHSVEPAGAHSDHNGKSVNLINAPGYPDFIGGAMGTMDRGHGRGGHQRHGGHRGQHPPAAQGGPARSTCRWRS